MGNRRIKVLIGITFSSLLICQIGVVPAFGAESSLLVEVEEEKWDIPIWDENGFRIRLNGDTEIYELTSFNASYVKLEENKYNIKIPTYGVDKICDNAFSVPSAEKENITTVSIPRFVNEIGNGSFKDCTGLTTVTFSKNLPYSDSNYHDLILGNFVFAGCTSLQTIDLSDLDRIKTVGTNLFEGCTSLQSVTLSNGMTEIPKNMFKDCTSLKYLEIPDNITTIDPTAFDGISGLTLFCKPGTNAAKAIEEYRKINPSITAIISTEKKDQKIEIYPVEKDTSLKKSFSIEDGTIIINCYKDDNAFFLNPVVTTGNGSNFTFRSDNSNIVSVDGNGLVTIKGIEGKVWIDIFVEETSIFNKNSLPVRIVVTEREKDPVIPPDDPNNPDKPNQPTNPDDPNSNPGGGNSNQSGGNENTNPVQKDEQEIEVKRIELTYGDSPFTIQPGSDMGKKVTFSSSNKKVFTVSSKGKITIKGCGLAKLKIKSKTATKTYEIVVKPKKNNITTLETKKRNIILKWKRDSKADGYYVYYTTDSKFKKNVKKIQIPKNKTLQCTLKKLKSGKKYYIKLYSYKKSGKTIILSDASKTKNIKVK